MPQQSSWSRKLYARAGVAECWIVNVLDRRVKVCRDPTPEPQARYGWTYRNVRWYATGDQISPLALPRARVPVADIVP